MADDDKGYDDESYEGYVPSGQKPPVGLSIVTLSLVCTLMFVIMPYIVFRKKRRRKKKENRKLLEMSKISGGVSDPNYVMMGSDDEGDFTFEKKIDKYKATFSSICRIDKETRRLLKYAIPFTVYSVSEEVMSSICLALIGQFLGSKQLIAYVLVTSLVEMTDSFLYGCMDANTTLCAHAIGANNNFLAGQYVQLSILFYLIPGVPILLYWVFYVDEVILWLGWGDETVAQHASDFALVYVWSHLISPINVSIDQLLEITGKEVVTTIIGLTHGATTTLILFVMFLTTKDVTLQFVGLIYLATDILFALIHWYVAFSQGWLKPFHKGLFSEFSMCNGQAVKRMSKTCIPLMIGSLLGNVEWTVLTLFTAHLGEGEVAAMAILGCIWELADCFVSGIGDAAEIRVSYHLGNNHPSLAKLSAYKSLFMGMTVAAVTSVLFCVYYAEIPRLFTDDEVLIDLISTAFPYLAIGNLALSFGYLCSYILGAQGKFKLETWIDFAVSWGVTIPLSFLFIYKLQWNIECLTAACVIGYCIYGILVAYAVLTSNWKRRAKKIYDLNNEDEEKHFPEEDVETITEIEENEEEEEMYAALKSKKRRGAKATARQNLLVLTAPPGVLGIRIANLVHRPGCTIVEVFPESPLYGQMFPGDFIISVNEVKVINYTADSVYEVMKLHEHTDRVLTVFTPPNHCQDENSNEVLVERNVPDILDFEAEGWEALLAERRLD